MILAQLPDGFLLSGIVFRPDDPVHPPFVAGRGAQHTAHQMIMSVCVREGMQGVVSVHTEFFRGDKDRAAGPQRNVAHAVSHGTGPHGCRRIISGSCHDLCRLRNLQLCRNLRQHRTDRLVGFVDPRQLFLADAADIQHLSGPAAVLHVEDQHAGSIGHVRAMNAGQPVRNIVLREHDLADPGKILGLFVLHPQDLRRRKAGEGNIRRIF